MEQNQNRLCDTAVLPKRKIIGMVNKKKEKTTKGGNMYKTRRCERNTN